ncbi:MAG: hypothetical protein AB3N23_22015 [Paracoccaceae bacterium]
MPLEILLVLVVFGISGIALLLHLTGRSKRPELTLDSARAAWSRHFPDDTIEAIQVSIEGHAALVHSDAGLGLLWVFGADTVARHLTGCDVTKTDTGLRVDFHDFAAPPAIFPLTTDERATWQAQMEAA